MLKINTLNRDSVIIRNNNLDCTSLNDDIIMMDVDKGRYFALNSVGSAIWDKLLAPTSIKDLVERLTSEFDIDEKQCYLEVIQFLNQLKESELVKII